MHYLKSLTLKGDDNARVMFSYFLNSTTAAERGTPNFNVMMVTNNITENIYTVFCIANNQQNTIVKKQQ